LGWPIMQFRRATAYFTQPNSTGPQHNYYPQSPFTIPSTIAEFGLTPSLRKSVPRFMNYPNRLLQIVYMLGFKSWADTFS
jgi:hypothetical protein